MSEFNKDEYRQRLIAHGIDPSSAAEVASKTAAARSMGQAAKPIGLAAEESSRIGGFQTVADPATVPEPETAAPQAATVASPAPSPTPFDEYWTRAYNNYKLDQAEEAARAGKTQPTRRERMASTSKKKPSTAIANLADQANQLEQAAVLKTTKAQIKKVQRSLFDRKRGPYPSCPLREALLRLGGGASSGAAATQPIGCWARWGVW
ncbi:MAG: plasmid replication initiator TrfA [Burkholderiales bacterium]